MTYAEVMRLRRLRGTALRTRALATVLDSDQEPRNSVFSRSAVSCWRVARVISGTLSAHPFLPYQRGPGEVRGAYDRVSANIVGGIARYKDRSFEVFSAELRRVARALDDARALTRSSDLSDWLGRSQVQLRRLIQEVETDERFESASQHEVARGVDGATAALESDAGTVGGSWPYLAF
jgi:hypothetical protein